MTPTHYSESGAFRETLDVVTVISEQLILVYSLREMAGRRAHLFTILEELPASLIPEVADFAESLLGKQSQVKEVQL